MSRPRILARDVPCPTCDAPGAVSCYTADGKRMETIHATRRERAQQINAEQFPVHVRGQIDLFGEEVSS